MLNISKNTISVKTEQYKTFNKIELTRANVMFRRWIVTLAVLSFLVLFLPWTQNIRAKGQVTTLTPDQRPQTINATIAGRIEQWYVREGQLVKKGDTIVRLSETKTDYFDPNLLLRTEQQVNAKTNSVESYASKGVALDATIAAMRNELRFKKEQLLNKIEQTKLKAEAERNDYLATKTDAEIEQKQLARTEELSKQGLKSLTEVENKRLKYQQSQAKLISADNKYRQSIQELDNLKSQVNSADSEYANKIAKAESDKYSTLSDKFDAEVTVSKLKNQYANYVARAAFYFITAPQDCYITSATAMGIGETVKEGEAIVNIVPSVTDLAVEVFVAPIDLPLIKIGTPMRFVFDGWPAFVFSGWPNASVGTYSGVVLGIDNVANDKSKYRLLVAPDPKAPMWPEALRLGGGAQAFVVLRDVPVWYELWRQLNGFPPEYYADFKVDKKDKK